MRIIILFISFLCLTSVASAKTYTVEMQRMTFSPEVLMINSGDTVSWQTTTFGHNVEMIASPNNMSFKSKPSTPVSLTFHNPGLYYYVCGPHQFMGMIGLIVVDNNFSNRDSVLARAHKRNRPKLTKLIKQAQESTSSVTQATVN